MTFKNVVMKNFIGNLRKYLSYFLSGVFCVAMFFTYSTLATIKSPVFLGTLCKCKAGRFSAQNPPGTGFFRRFAARRRSGTI